MFKKILFLLAAIILISESYAQNSIKVNAPNIKGNSSFAIFVDEVTYSKIGKSIDDYKNSVESKNLPCYVISSKWNTPDEIKEEILKLYNSKPKLEGVVFIGDIPIAMIRDAQHYSSAFKMDQKKFAFKRSSIPSDRFYDDFDLHFKFLKKDSTDELINYYSLLSNSSPVIEKEIYSARIKPTIKGEGKYAQIEKFLKKVVRVKKEKNELNKFVYGLGEGYVSDAQDAFTSEILSYYESFPKTREQNGLFNKFFHLTSDQFKNSYLRQLDQIEDLDLSLLTAHGEPWYQFTKYIKPKDTTQAAKDFADSLSHILVGDIRNQKINSRVNICNSCFNGAFINYPYLGGEYIFTEGNCVVNRANSVNELQDVWTLEDAGLLAEGVSVGKWHQVSNNYLESHLFGDPTFAFDAPENKDLSFIMDSHDKSDLIRLQSLALKSELPAARGLALVEIVKLNGKESAPFLKNIFLNDKSSDVRTKALRLICRFKGPEFEEVIKAGVNDPNEFIRRVSVKLLGEVGREDFIPMLMNSMLMDPSERVTSSAETSLLKIDPKKSYEFGMKLINSEKKYQADSLFIKRVTWSLKYKIKSLNDETIPKLENKSAKGRMTELKSLRGNRFNVAPKLLLKLITDNSENLETRTTAAEAIGWYYYNYDIDTYIPKLEAVVKEPSFPADVKDVLVMTIQRLKIGPNYTLTP
jgi:hypothetical protein